MAPTGETSSQSTSNDSKLVEYKALRASTKGNLTRIKNKVLRKDFEASKEDIACRLEILEAYYKHVLTVQEKIDVICPESDREVNEAAMADIEEIYIQAKLRLNSYLPVPRLSVADVSNLNTSFVPVSRMQKQIKLPKFEGKYSDFPKFVALFNKLVDQDAALDNCEKFLILKDSLGSRALQCIADFDETDENYPKALKRLVENFDKKMLMFEEHIGALFSMEKMRSESSMGLRQINDSVNAHISAMLSLGTYEQMANAMIINLVMSKVDAGTQVKWEESVDYTKLSSWTECSAVLSRRCQTMEAREVKAGSTKDMIKDPVKPKWVSNCRKGTQSSLTIERASCGLCQAGEHEVSDCPNFKGANPSERYQLVRRLKLCLVCLKSGHMRKDCKAPKCVFCKFSHHKMLHRNRDISDSNQGQAAANNQDAQPSTSQVSLHASAMMKSQPTEVFLVTAKVLVKDVAEKWHEARVLLDSASQLNLMCEYLAQKLRLKKMTCVMGVNGVGDSSTKMSKKVIASVKSRCNGFEESLSFYILPKITGKKPDNFTDISRWHIPGNIELADPWFNVPAPVDMLLGAELFMDLLSVGRIQLGENLPCLQKTVLGWVVSGIAQGKISSKASTLTLSVEMPAAHFEDDELSKMVEKFWLVEELPKTKFWTDEEQKCENQFLNTVPRSSDGRFVVKIPFKDNLEDLGESFYAAERRFFSLERRLNKNPILKKAYSEFMDEYIQLGHMEKVSDENVASLKYFAPHQCVLRPESTSTKLRVVFDCSAKTSSGLSLNDVMMKGPTVQDDLLSIVLRFRCYKYALTADVTKMYRQIGVTPNDMKYQAILWRDRKEDKLAAYKLCTVTYGTTSAPFLATRCLKKLADDNSEDKCVASMKIRSDFYMDDFISGANSEEEIFQIYEEVTAVMNSAHLPLKKWHSNCGQFLSQVPESDRGKSLRLNDAEIIKTLGIVWEPIEDQFRYISPEIIEHKSITKRIVLAELSTLFDPLGLINPVIVKAKIFMQDLWILKLKWDESLPLNMHAMWTEFRQKLKQVHEVIVPRYIMGAKAARIELHGFSDASRRAYGCCVYVRTIDDKDNVTVNLWSAKSRVAPLSTKSTPRLELMGACLLCCLLEKTLTNFPATIDGIYLWTDSEIVLDWLKVHPSTWSTFVANRVAIIQEATKNGIWRHVPSKMNPADIISKGAYVEEIVNNSLWFSGPLFLQNPVAMWPLNKERKKRSDEEMEKRTATTTLNLEKVENHVIVWIENHSDVESLQRKVARLLLAFRRKCVYSDLSVSQLEEALIRIIYCLQQHYFDMEFKSLQKEALPANSKYQNLSLFIDKRSGVELIRVGGRLKRADLPYDSKHPILLPAQSSFVNHFIRFLHLRNLHVGTQALMAILCQRFWVVNARKVVRSVTSKCLVCFRCRPMLEQQIMADLPHDRVSPSKPFSNTGVDFCGPMMITAKLRGVRLIKAYVAVFVCFSTKALHLEVVSDLTTKAFIGALKRFVARRGLCGKLYCDNATNFVGARREMEDFKKMFFDQITQNHISKYCTEHQIDFKHIPPRSPHFGGLWEAAVKSAKYHLTRAVGSAYLTYEELSTVVAEIEAILNSRPLTTISSDPNDEEVITPGHFLVGGPLVGITEPLYAEEKMSAMNRWLRVSAIQQHFWKRWSKEYLHELQRRMKWTTRKPNVAEGDLVLVSEDNLPPKQWLIGRVIHVIPDAEGDVRVVDVRTKNGVVRRAIQKIAPIPKDDRIEHR